MKRLTQTRAASPEDIARPLHPTRGGDDRLTIAQINDRFLHYEGKHWRRSVYRFLQARGIAKGRRSRRCLLIKQAHLERALSGAPLSQQQRG